MAESGVTSVECSVHPGAESELKDDAQFEAALREIAAAPAVDPRDRRPLQRGDVVDGTYRVEEVIGAGGMGVVYRAVDLALDRPVALKLRLTETDPRQLERLWREARVMARLSHPNVVTIYEVGRWRNHLFIAMEHIEGGTVRSWLAARPRLWHEIVALYIEAAKGLMAAHRAGIIHRDFKPDNVLVDAGASEELVRALVADFGLAQPSEQNVTHDDLPVLGTRGETTGDPGEGSGGRLTHTGALLGTRGYMAPEQLEGLPVDERADQFSFCVSLYEGLCGRLPFDSETPAAWEKGPLSPPEERSVPSHVWRALQRGLRREPAERWPHLQNLVDALGDDPLARRRRRFWTAVGGLGILGLGLAAYRAGREQPVDCSSGESSITDVWNEQARGRLEGAFETTRSPLASAMSAKVANLLDAYATSWAATHRSACEATHHHHAQSEAVLDRQMACLERRKQGLIALVDVFVEAAEPTVIERAVEAVGGLDDLQTCRQIDTSDTRVEPPSIELAPVVQEIRDALSIAKANRLAGRVEESTKQARAALDRARESGYRPLVAEARFELGEALSAAGQERAAEELTLAHLEAVAVGDDALAAVAATNLISTARSRKDALDQALLWYEVARAFHERVGTADATKAIRLGARGAAYLMAREFEKARADIEAALPLAEPGLRVRLLGNLGTVHHEQANYQEALRLREQAVKESIDVYGENHPEVANLEEGLAVTYRDVGRLEDALAASERSMERWRRSVGPENLRMVEAYNKRAAFLGQAGDERGALEGYREALALLERVGPEAAEARVNLSSNLGSTLIGLEEYEEAALHLQRAAALASEHLGPDHFKTGVTELNLANLRGIQGESEKAVQHAERAVEILRAAMGEQHPNVAIALLSLAAIYMDLEQLDDARRMADEAAVIVEAAFSEPERTRARVGMVRARLARMQERWKDVVAEAEVCVQVMAKTGGEDHPERLQCMLELGRGHAGLGNRAQAIETLEKALAKLEAGVSPASGTAASIRFELARLLPASERERSVTLARQALDAIEPDGPEGADRRSEIDAWLAARGAAAE